MGITANISVRRMKPLISKMSFLYHHLMVKAKGKTLREYVFLLNTSFLTNAENKYHYHTNNNRKEIR